HDRRDRPARDRMDARRLRGERGCEHPRDDSHPTRIAAMTETTLTPSRLWKKMSLEQRQRAARAFWEDEEGTNDQVQAALLIAQQKKFRPKTVIALDLDRKTRHLASLVTLPDAIAARALITYHLAEQRPMMGAFLDALGITHENGLIQQEDVKPDPSKVPPAAAELASKFPQGDVQLYLNTLLAQDPETWQPLREVAILRD
ncbi:MAG TPA: hypothetical protein VKB52_02915, partial [Rhodanobacteraceae bacterium]|nr:hypothetical protein [Rhodanobacteraceae bacterium]